MGVLTGDPPGGQCLDSQIGDRILRHRQLRKRVVELLEAVVDDGAGELRNPTEVVVNDHRRQPGRGRHCPRLDSGWALLGQ